nr:GNAT family protein [Streptomyces sp. SID3343]
MRRFRPADAPALAAYRSDEAVAHFQGWTPPVTRNAADSLVREFARGDPSRPGWFHYAVELKADGCLVGDVGVNLHRNRKQAEVGYSFAVDRQGHGYAREALTAVLRDLFGRGLHRVSADCDARNVRSARLLDRVGFRLEGRRPAYAWLASEWTDDLLFTLLADQWKDPAA